MAMVSHGDDGARVTIRCGDGLFDEPEVLLDAFGVASSAQAHAHAHALAHAQAHAQAQADVGPDGAAQVDVVVGVGHEGQDVHVAGAALRGAVEQWPPADVAVLDSTVGFENC